MKHRIHLPLSDEKVRVLRVADEVLLSGILVTGRDQAHKWLHDCFVQKLEPLKEDQGETLNPLVAYLQHGAIYHCGPVVSGLDAKNYQIESAGPTTSIRQEPYQAAIIHQFHLKCIIGKGGMGPATLNALRQAPAVYLQATGGAGALLAQTVLRVIEVFKPEFGVAEAMWVLEVQDFPGIVSMDSYGNSLHDQIRQASCDALKALQ